MPGDLIPQRTRFKGRDSDDEGKGVGGSVEWSAMEGGVAQARRRMGAEEGTEIPKRVVDIGHLREER